MIVGYDRVLKAAGAERHFRQRKSGATTTYRRQPAKAIDILAAGDVLLISRLDRLARSADDLLNTLATITRKKAGLRSLAGTWTDGAVPHGRLTRTARVARQSLSGLSSLPG